MPLPQKPFPIKPLPPPATIQLAPKAPAASATPEPDLAGRAFLLQPWITIRGSTSAPAVTSVTQDDALWMDLRRFADAGFWIDVSGVTNAMSGSVFLNIEGSPTLDEQDFRPVAPPLALSPRADGSGAVAPLFIKTVRAASTVPLCRYTRWRLSATGTSGVWDASFRIRGIGGSSRFWSPVDIAGLQFWARADMGLTLNSSNGVTAWADQSGASHGATSSGATPPTFLASSINGAPAISFDPSAGAQYMTTNAFLIGTYTVLMVSTGQNPASAIGWFWTRGTNAGGVADTLYGTINSTIYCTRSGVTSDANNGAGGWGQYGASTAKLLQVSMDGTHAGHKLRINGADVTLNGGTAGDPGSGTTNHPFAIAASAAGVLPSRIKIAEVIVYDHALTPNQLALLEEYLRRRYALY